MKPIRYVMMVAIDPKSGFAVGLTKKKGPAFLINRLTFPGGKIEEGETPEAAASREMFEEAGIQVAATEWRLLKCERTEQHELHIFVASTPKVLHARQCESEPVWQMDCAAHLRYAANQPNAYAPDFIPVLSTALSMVGVNAPAENVARENAMAP